MQPCYKHINYVSCVVSPRLLDPGVHHVPAGAGEQGEGHHHAHAVAVVGLAQEPATTGASSQGTGASSQGTDDRGQPVT